MTLPSDWTYVGERDAPSFESDWTSFRQQVRLDFMMAAFAPTVTTEPAYLHHERMERYHLDRVHALSRPPYLEARGFTPDRWQLAEPVACERCGRRLGERWKNVKRPDGRQLDVCVPCADAAPTERGWAVFIRHRTMRSLAGIEHPYGWGSRAYWRAFRHLLRSAFLAGWHQSHGTEREVRRGNPRAHVTVTGIA